MQPLRQWDDSVRVTGKCALCVCARLLIKLVDKGVSCLCPCSAGAVADVTLPRKAPEGSLQVGNLQSTLKYPVAYDAGHTLSPSPAGLLDSPAPISFALAGSFVLDLLAAPCESVLSSCLDNKLKARDSLIK